jgi:hypothetical protein
MALFAVAWNAGRVQIVAVVRSAAGSRRRVFNLPCSPGPDDAVVAEANLALADVATARSKVVDGVEIVRDILTICCDDGPYTTSERRGFLAFGPPV